MTVKKTFVYSILTLFAVILMVPAASGAGETRVISHDGINGWACWTSGSVPCGGGHPERPITVQQSSDYGKPTPSLKITGNVQTNEVACASKTISSTWDIYKISLSFDVLGSNTQGYYPVIIINDQRSGKISGDSYEWIHGNFSEDISNQESVEVRLCIFTNRAGSDPLTEYYDNIKITTTEVDPTYVAAQEEAERQAEQETEDAKKAADAAEKAAKAAADAAEEAEREAEAYEEKAESDEKRAAAMEKTADAIERSKDAAKDAMHSAKRAMEDAKSAQEFAEREAAYMKDANRAMEKAVKAQEKAAEAEKRLAEAERAFELNQQGKAEEKAEDAKDAADAAREYADDVQYILASFPSAFAQSESGGGVVSTPGGGCLIATAAFGSEMAPQVQLLREIRDNTVLQTESGTNFMTGFNQFYYSFSPAVADYERENPAFKEAVKITLTPLLTSLTLLQYADIDSESEMLGYGIGVILLNIGMYFVAPAVLIMAVRKRI